MGDQNPTDQSQQPTAPVPGTGTGGVSLPTEPAAPVVPETPVTETPTTEVPVETPAVPETPAPETPSSGLPTPTTPGTEAPVGGTGDESGTGTPPTTGSTM